MPKTRRFLLGFVLLFSPLFVWPRWGDSIREPKIYFLLASGSLILALQAVDARRSWQAWRKLPSSILFFLLYILVQSLIFRPTSSALLDAWLLIASLAVALEFSTTEETAGIDACLRWLAWINIFYGSLQILGVDPIFASYEPGITHTPTGFMGHRTLYGPLMVMLMGCNIAHKRHWTALVCFLLAAATHSAMTMYSALACLTAFLWLRKKYRALVCLLAGSFLLSLVGFLNRDRLPFFAESGRFRVWQLALNDALEMPWFGHGFNTFGKFFGVKYQFLLQRPWVQAHQEFLQAFFELGIVGVFFLAWMFSDFVFRFGEKITSPHIEAWFLIFVIGIADSLANFPLHVAPLALFTLCGWLLIAQRGVPTRSRGASSL